jgi:hypothetical protein
MIVRGLAHFYVEMSTFPQISREKNPIVYYIYRELFFILIFNRKKINISTYPLFYKEKIDIKSTFNQH